MGRVQHVPVTPEVVQWAIQESGLDEADVSESLGVSFDALRGWQDGTVQPTKTEFDGLARLLKRPSAVFLLPTKPQVRTPDVAFRRPHNSARTKLDARERRFVRESSRVQRTLSWILRETEAPPLTLPQLDVQVKAERAAIEIRQFLIGDESRPARPLSDVQSQRTWRARLEEAGVLVFLLPMGKDAVRGFSLFDDRAPLVAVNTHWNYNARVFSLLHEFAHLVSRTNSACAAGHIGPFPNREDRVERWCEEVAAGVLIPWADAERVLSTELLLRPGQRVTTLEQLYVFAKAFSASARAAALRLIHRHRADWALFRSIPPAQDQKRQGGRGGEGRDRSQIREDEYGERTIRAFARAVDRGLLPASDASGFLRMSYADLQRWQ